MQHLPAKPSSKPSSKISSDTNGTPLNDLAQIEIDLLPTRRVQIYNESEVSHSKNHLSFIQWVTTFISFTFHRHSPQMILWNSKCTRKRRRWKHAYLTPSCSTFFSRLFPRRIWLKLLTVWNPWMQVQGRSLSSRVILVTSFTASTREPHLHVLVTTSQ